jgi:hypothetical protein
MDKKLATISEWADNAWDDWGNVEWIICNAQAKVV